MTSDGQLPLSSDSLVEWQKDRKQLSWAAGVIIAAVIVAALYFAREVLIPITLAALLTFILAPLVNLLRKIRIPRVPAIIVAVVLALGIIIGIGTVIGTQIADLAGQLPNYQNTIESKLANLRDTTLKPINDAIARFQSRSEEKAANPASQQPSPAPDNAGQKPVPVQVQQPPLSPMEVGQKLIEPVLHPLATIIIMMVVTFFALLYREDIRDRAIRLFGSGDLSRTTTTMDDAGRRLSRYFIAQLAINSAFGVVVAVGTYFIGLPHPILWGALGAILRFVPYIGAWIAAALPTLLAAAVDPGWSMVFMTIGLYAITEFLAGQILEPLLYGHSTGLSPIAVVVAAIFWTWLWGPIGLIISTPLTLCAVVLGRHVGQLSFFDILLGSSPALRPSESLYQRLLAGDLDEAQDQLENFAEEHSLLEFYDDVAVEALQFATADFRSGKLSHSAASKLRATFEELIEFGQELLKEDQPEQTEPALKAGAQVLCMPGQGPFDGLAASMLAQVLNQAGVAASTPADDAVLRQTQGSPRKVSVAYVLSLQTGKLPANARLLIRRLKKRNSEAKVVLGLVEKSAGEGSDKLSKIGADQYVASLQEALAVLPRLIEAAPERPTYEAAARDRDGSDPETRIAPSSVASI